MLSLTEGFCYDISTKHEKKETKPKEIKTKRKIIRVIENKNNTKKKHPKKDAENGALVDVD